MAGVAAEPEGATALEVLLELERELVVECELDEDRALEVVERVLDVVE